MTTDLNRPLPTRVLVANRGEIACRIFRTVHALGGTAIAVFSDADAQSRHVREADISARLGPAPARESYLSIDRVIEAARLTGADAVHPGYGFLAENAEFAAACIAAGLIWVGPPPAAIEAMGDKISAKQIVSKAGVAVVPGRAVPGMSNEDLADAAREIGWPVLIKPSAGGGGKGMHVVTGDDGLLPALERARREAAASFGDDTLFVERYVSTPRHIEVQVLADAHGAVIHLGERECSLQRRHQKVIEEAPSPLLDAAIRDRIGLSACETARAVGYSGAGTIEFIVSADAPGDFFFMEMNTRLQVEHPVTEMVTGIDLVEAQLRVAADEPLWLTQADVNLRGHAIEARVYAEDPSAGFLPTSGTIYLLREPAGAPIRVDSGMLAGQPVATDYDPMLSKVIAYGADRAEALVRLDAGLAETVVLGVTTNIAFLRGLLADRDVVAGRLDTGLIERLPLPAAVPPTPAYAVAALSLLGRETQLGRDAQLGRETAGDDPWNRRDGWRLGGVRSARRWRFARPDGQPVTVAATAVPGSGQWLVSVIDDAPIRAEIASIDATSIGVLLDGDPVSAHIVHDSAVTWLHLDGEHWTLEQLGPARVRSGLAEVGDGDVRSPMPGTVISVAVVVGEAVTAGAPVAVVEAMKMEHTVLATVDGRVEVVNVSAGESVARNQLLATITPAASS